MQSPATYIYFLEMMHPVSARIESRVGWGPVPEAIKIIGVVSIIVVVVMLKGNESDLSALPLQLATSTDVLHNNVIYLWLTGIFLGFLRNAPVSLTFFNSAGGDFSVLQAFLVTTLIAIFARIVFIGSSEYIRGRLNFIVRPNTGCRGIPMSGFFEKYRWVSAVFDAVAWSCYMEILCLIRQKSAR